MDFLLLLYFLVTVAVLLVLLIDNRDFSFEKGFEFLRDVPSIRDTLKDSLMFFAADGEEKTEKASHKKLEDAKKKGQSPKSQDVGIAVSLLFSFVLITVFGETFISEIKSLMVFFIEASASLNISANPTQLTPIIFKVFLKFLVLLFIPIMLSGIIVNIAQTGFVLTGEQIKPKLSKLNPINGFKEMFSQRRLFDFIKHLAKLIVVIVISLNFILDRQGMISELPYLELNQGIALFGSVIKELFMIILGVIIVIAAIDYGYQRYDFLKKQRMTKQEVKEEYKQAEGDPYIKGLRRQRQRELARNRMMAAVPEATVVVTNPTHFAVAIKYNDTDAKIPIVVAKGADNLALKIKGIAKEHDVIIIENKPLARTLYKVTEVDREIPFEMYKAVAELLGLVYRLERKRKFK